MIVDNAMLAPSGPRAGRVAPMTPITGAAMRLIAGAATRITAGVATRRIAGAATRITAGVATRRIAPAAMRITAGVTLALALGVALPGSAARASLPPLPLPLPSPLPPVPPLPGNGNGAKTPPKAHPAPPPPRPSRSPPSQCSGQSAPGPVAFVSAVFPCDFPDPMVLRADGRWFAYGSSTGWEQAGRSLPILSSTDLRHWRFVADALPAAPSWSNGDLWGPSVVRWRGRYLLFFNAKQRGTGRHCLTVATAAGPQGPFLAGGPLACRARHQRGFIDPAPLVAAHRTLYLFFSVDSPRHMLDAVRLSSSGLRVQGRPRIVLRFSPRWGLLRSRTVEGPWPLRRNGFFYLFYSAGSWVADYRMSYAVAESPLGPYSDSAPVPILGAGPALRAPGGGSVVTGSRGLTWLAFAAWSGAPGYQLGSERTMRIAPLTWTGRGVPQVVLGGG